MSEFTDYDINPLSCLGCGQKQDGALSTKDGKDRAPRDGDVAMCAACNQLAKYVEVDGKFTFRYLTDDELKDVLGNPHVQRVIAATMQARERHNKNHEKRRKLAEQGVPEDTVWDVLPCGCRIAVNDTTMEFFYEPCAPDCEFFQHTVRAAEEVGKPIDVRMIDE